MEFILVPSRGAALSAIAMTKRPSIPHRRTDGVVLDANWTVSGSPEEVEGSARLWKEMVVPVG
jgi:hypothetical protein